MSDPLYMVDESQLVLCPELYSRLRQNFPGGVLISNQGEGMLHSSAVDGMGRLYTSIHHSGEYYRVSCTFCKDTRHRLWVNHMYGQPDVNGRPMRFLAKCYNEDCLADPVNWKRFDDALLGFRNAHSRHRPAFALNPAAWVDPGQLHIVEPPGQVVPVSRLARSMPDHPAVQYMCHDRRYSLHMLDYYEVGYCEYAPKYPTAQGRIIFPIRMHGQFVGWQARYIGTADWRCTPKYYGLPGMKKRLMLYNYDRAQTKPFVVVVEGVTDCHILGDYGVALLGKDMSRFHLDMLLNTWAGRPIILVFDPEAMDDMRSAMLDLQYNNAVVAAVSLPLGYDCGDYDPRGLWNIIYAQTRQMGIILPAA